LNQRGSWWWHNARRATDYENDFYKVKVADDDFSYLLQLKHPQAPNTVILFQNGGVWKEVDRNKLNVEQW
jgi:hypothetical protein